MRTCVRMTLNLIKDEWDCDPGPPEARAAAFSVSAQAAGAIVCVCVFVCQITTGEQNSRPKLE